MNAARGLIIKAPWTDLIFSGCKTWEIRGAKTNIRGRIAIIQSGTKHIYGYADLVDCIGPLTVDQMNLSSNRKKHSIPLKVENEDEMPYPKTYAWVLDKVEKLKPPIPYKHPSGAIIWVNLENQ